MNSKRCRLLAVSGLSVLLLSGCVHRTVVVREPAQVVVSEPPPAPRVESVPASPGVDYTWTPGYWEWNGKRYDWHKGKWTKAPRMGAVWVEGHWEQYPSGWVWVPGRWK